MGRHAKRSKPKTSWSKAQLEECKLDEQELKKVHYIATKIAINAGFRSATDCRETIRGITKACQAKKMQP